MALTSTPTSSSLANPSHCAESPVPSWCSSETDKSRAALSMTVGLETFTSSPRLLGRRRQDELGGPELQCFRTLGEIRESWLVMRLTSRQEMPSKSSRSTMYALPGERLFTLTPTIDSGRGSRTCRTASGISLGVSSILGSSERLAL
ncbi:unnamed protein product [Phytomonas sp. Hart1]|nr:unnamed protein product [Phytomonas sp. Hart1]|eukprot:CCW68103.1 unnamed protein product [Phytomonas sp. isolate Hart1]